MPFDLFLPSLVHIHAQRLEGLSINVPIEHLVTSERNTSARHQIHSFVCHIHLDKKITETTKSRYDGQRGFVAIIRQLRNSYCSPHSSLARLLWGNRLKVLLLNFA